MSWRFFHIIKSEKPVVVDFFAEWCEPCRQVPVVLKEVKSELKRNIRVVKVDVDKNPLIASKYRIQHLPTVMVFQNGEPRWSGVGMIRASEIKSVLQGNVPNTDNRISPLI
ncbi:MAG: thioredoxin family protein [Draconibacterium sp.]|jgi:thioredoxin 1